MNAAHDDSRSCDTCGLPFADYGRCGDCRARLCDLCFETIDGRCFECYTRAGERFLESQMGDEPEDVAE